MKKTNLLSTIPQGDSNLWGDKRLKIYTAFAYPLPLKEKKITINNNLFFNNVFNHVNLVINNMHDIL